MRKFRKLLLLLNEKCTQTSAQTHQPNWTAPVPEQIYQLELSKATRILLTTSMLASKQRDSNSMIALLPSTCVLHLLVISKLCGCNRAVFGKSHCTCLASRAVDGLHLSSMIVLSIPYRKGLFHRGYSSLFCLN